MSIALLAAGVLVATGARAAAPCDTVRSFFAALGRHDFSGALGMTAGPAATTLGGVFGAAEQQAARAHAALEVEVRDLHVTEGVPDAAGRTPVDVHYEVNVFGKKLFFKSLVKRIVGSSQFVVDRGRIASLGTFSP
jgi:hypothetical protein